MENLKQEISYNKENQLLAYSFKMDSSKCYSTFQVNLNILEEVLIDQALIDRLNSGEKILIDIDLFNEIQEKWFLFKNYKHKGIWFPKDANRDFVEVFMEAYEKKCLVLAMYEEGYECYPSEEDEDAATCSNDGLVHVYRVGITTGKNPSPLALETSHARGGSIFMFSGLIDLKLLKY